MFSRCAVLQERQELRELLGGPEGTCRVMSSPSRDTGLWSAALWPCLGEALVNSAVRELQEDQLMRRDVTMMSQCHGASSPKHRHALGAGEWQTFERSVSAESTELSVSLSCKTCRDDVSDDISVYTNRRKPSRCHRNMATNNH